MKDRACGYCGHERFMHERYRPQGLLDWLFMPRWFTGKCLSANCDCEIYIYGHSYRKELRESGTRE